MRLGMRTSADLAIAHIALHMTEEELDDAINDVRQMAGFAEREGDHGDAIALDRIADILSERGAPF